MLNKHHDLHSYIQHIINDEKNEINKKKQTKQTEDKNKIKLNKAKEQDRAIEIVR